jgi:stage II sporulation protein D
MALSPARALESPLIRVRTQREQDKAMISGFGVRLNGRQITKTILPKRVSLQIESEEGQWHVRGLGLAGDAEVLHLPMGELEISGDDLKVNGQLAPDQIVLARSADGDGDQFDVILELALEDYLKGVLPSEMPSRWPIESLKAQAVASRSYALNEIRVRHNEPFHVDDSILHQVFNWSKYLSASSSDQEKIRKILSETEGQILVDDSGAPLKAYFHSDCGGHTEEPANVWGDSPKFGTVADSYCALNRKGQWTEEISRKEFSRLLAQQFELGPEAEVTSIKIASLSSSGRVLNLKIGFRKGVTPLLISAQNLRQIVGFTRLKSTHFRVETLGSTFRFSGRGNGHGVGLCQHGAKSLALAGADSSSILKHYYPSAHLHSIKDL